MIFVIHTDRYSQEYFSSEEDAEQYCLSHYGPDRKEWPEIIATKPWEPVGVANGRYVAVAWWPREHYEVPPEGPCIVSAWTTKEGVPSRITYVTAGEPIFTAEDKTSPRSAERAAHALANKNQPKYELHYSSNTTGGRLPVYCRTDMPVKRYL
mgnify:FL=1